ncbi:MAG TPA: hypothetical protein DCP75_18280 [Haliea salexigens]|uniref:HPr-rel-A system PqqD family peptide chaperone n=1 Tax=Haliea salexigens TaxID=287487 RepID=A0A3C1KSE3_9GAMM|nr:hypothetical protein [Haliea sp.]HAN29632.1 hypothetical protein [Haliea salexigens]|tara:strand:+ start:154 stop:438 length:285 start_codon:yes stop_codon:yes gene_type:complete
MMHGWQLTSHDTLILEEVGDCVAVYSSATGETHLLDALPAEVLSCLSSGACLTHLELAVAVAEVADEPWENWQPQVCNVLERLASMQLVERFAR